MREPAFHATLPNDIGLISYSSSQNLKRTLSTGPRAVESFYHGRDGSYSLMKYTTARTASGGYDFYIAKYGYRWTLDVISLQEAADMKRLSERKVTE